ncbi:MAG: TIM barrel protein [Chloroflexi bacterium]|nr:TIM barrel protein [Chloroflexota bacterium]
MIYTGYIDFWFQDVPLVERVARFARLGIRPIDIWMWRSNGAVLMDDVAAACRESGCYINSTFDESAGSLTDANDHAHCIDAWAESLELAQRWGVKHLFIFSEQIDPFMPPAGVTSDINGWSRHPSRNYSPEEKYANFLAGVSRVMELVEKTDVVVWLEALNTYHLQGPITIHTHALAADAVRRINHPQFRMTFDCYHQQRTAGNLIYGLNEYRGLYDSVHVGDVPTRQEPGTGEINFLNIARTLKALNYDADGRGLIGLEFAPSTNEAEALARVRRLFEDDS